WTRNKLHAPMTSRAILLDDLRACDIGWHQVGRELDPFEREVEHAGDGTHEQSFCEPGNTGDDRVTTDKEREQDLFDNFVLSDDVLPDSAQEALARGPDFIDQFPDENG